MDHFSGSHKHCKVDYIALVVRDGSSNTATTRWIVHSGVSHQMILHKYFFDTYEPILGRKVFMGDNNMVKAVGKGFILVETRVEGRAWSIRMHDVLHVPNLISTYWDVW